MIRLADLQVSALGECAHPSPLAAYVAGRSTNEYYVAETDRVLVDDTVDQVLARGDLPVREWPSFEPGGPRQKLFFDPKAVRVGIVTCGGLCPGLNDVIRALVLQLSTHYGCTDVLGFRNGYAGLVPEGPEPVVLTPGRVAGINERGGTILGSSRGGQDPDRVVDRLVKLGVDILFVIGGDGSMRGAHALTEVIGARGLHIAVVGIPKTIDNDLPYVGQSFGFGTAFGEAARTIQAAKVEASAAEGGVAVVKVMGRHAGFIACYAALAHHDADFVLIPEVPFTLAGKKGLLASLVRRVEQKGSAVVVLAEGAGQELLPADDRTDPSGNAVLGDIAAHLRTAIVAEFARRQLPVTMRYLDPGYAIRSVPADATDSVYCARLAQTAVHAAMAGRTDLVVGRRRHRFVHVPIPLVIERAHRVAPDGDLWLSVLESTAQPATMA